MYTGSLPPTSIYNTWIENIEIISADDGELYDLSGMQEITVSVLNPKSKFAELTLTMSAGDITLPSLGIIQWSVPGNLLGSLDVKLYEVTITLEDSDGNIILLVLGTISILD